MSIRYYHLAHEDGAQSIMQVLRDDAEVEAEIAKGAWHAPVVGYRPVTREEADAIRAARPRPEPGVPPVSHGSSGMSEADRAALEAENARLTDQIAALSTEFDKFRADTQHNFSVMIERVAQKMLEVSPLPVEEKQQ